MHKHLLAWRTYRGLSQEAVGAALGVRHTTIGRWERGTMKLSVQDLQRLAEVYNCTVTQLASPPEAAELVGRLDQAQDIMEHMDSETLDQWLALGRKLAQK